MVVQKFFLEDFFEIRNFLVKTLTFSTAGWSKGLIFIILPSAIVSKINSKNNLPNVFSSNFLITTSLKGVLFFFKISIKAFFCDTLTS